MNTFIKILLLVTAVYFLGHIAYALADTVVFTPDGRVVTCMPAPNGTVLCL